MVARRATKSVVAFQPISDRLAVLTISGTIKTHLDTIYAPTETSPDPAKDDFYNQLQHMLDSVSQTELIILLETSTPTQAPIGLDGKAR